MSQNTTRRKPVSKTPIRSTSKSIAQGSSSRKEVGDTTLNENRGELATRSVGFVGELLVSIQAVQDACEEANLVNSVLVDKLNTLLEDTIAGENLLASFGQSFVS